MSIKYREICPLIFRQNFNYDSDTGILYRKNGRIAGFKDKKGYIKVSLKNKNYLAHRVAWACFYGQDPGSEIDHINRNRSDNRICNLRLVDRSENMQNMRLDSLKRTSSMAGAHKDKRRDSSKFYSAIKVRGKKIYLGVFDTEQQASDAYFKAKEIYHFK